MAEHEQVTGGAFVGRLAMAEDKADAMGAATNEAEEKADVVGLLYGYSRGGGEGGCRGRSWRMVRRPPVLSGLFCCILLNLRLLLS